MTCSAFILELPFQEQTWQQINYDNPFGERVGLPSGVTFDYNRDFRSIKFGDYILLRHRNATPNTLGGPSPIQGYVVYLFDVTASKPWKTIWNDYTVKVPTPPNFGQELVCRVSKNNQAFLLYYWDSAINPPVGGYWHMALFASKTGNLKGGTLSADHKSDEKICDVQEDNGVFFFGVVSSSDKFSKISSITLPQGTFVPQFSGSNKKLEFVKLLDGPTPGSYVKQTIDIKNDGDDCAQAIKILDAKHFKLSNPDVLTDGLAANKTGTCEVEFVADNQSSEFNENINITQQLADGRNKEVKIPCHGRVRKSNANCKITQYKGSQTIIIGQNWNSASGGSFTIENYNEDSANLVTDPLEITKIANGQLFKVVKTVPELPATLSPRQTLHVELSFQTDQPGVVSEKLQVTRKPAKGDEYLECSGSARCPTLEVLYGLINNDGKFEELPRNDDKVQFFDIGDIWVDRPGILKNLYIINASEIDVTATMTANNNKDFSWRQDLIKQEKVKEANRSELEKLYGKHYFKELPAISFKPVQHGPFTVTLTTQLRPPLGQDIGGCPVYSTNLLISCAEVKPMPPDALEVNDSWVRAIGFDLPKPPKSLNAFTSEHFSGTLHNAEDEDFFTGTFVPLDIQDSQGIFPHGWQLQGGSLGMLVRILPPSLTIVLAAEYGTHVYDRNRQYKACVDVYDSKYKLVGSTETNDFSKPKTLRFYGPATFPDLTFHAKVKNPDYLGQGPLEYGVSFNNNFFSMEIQAIGTLTALRYVFLRSYYEMIWRPNPPIDFLGKVINFQAWLDGKPIMLTNIGTYLTRHMAFFSGYAVLTSIAHASAIKPFHILADEYINAAHIARAAGLFTQAQSYYTKSAINYLRAGQGESRIYALFGLLGLFTDHGLNAKANDLRTSLDKLYVGGQAPDLKVMDKFITFNSSIISK